MKASYHQPSVYSRPPCLSVVLHQPANSCNPNFLRLFTSRLQHLRELPLSEKCFSVNFNSPGTHSKSGVNKREWALKVGSVHWKPLVLTGQLHVRGGGTYGRTETDHIVYTWRGNLVGGGGGRKNTQQALWLCLTRNILNWIVPAVVITLTKNCGWCKLEST